MIATLCGISLYAVLGWFGLLAVCIALNELCRLNKWFSLFMFLVLPAILTFTLWPQTAGAGSSMGVWFYWVKVYSVLAGCLGFMAIRFVPGLAKNKWALFFPAFILALNIGEAVVRDFEVYTLHATGQLIDGWRMLSGPWNIMNGIAGILNIATISGWAGIFISKDKKKDIGYCNLAAGNRIGSGSGNFELPIATDGPVSRRSVCG